MNPYVTLPLSLPGDPDTGDKDKIVDGRIHPLTVIAYHPGYYWGTFLYTAIGQVFLLTCTDEEYERSVKEHLKKNDIIGRIKIDPFLSIPLLLTGDAEKKEGAKQVTGKILPAHVMTFHEGYYGGTFLYLTAGHFLQSTQKPEEYEKSTKQYWNEMAKNAISKSRVIKLQ